jgi:hypothetical protein
MPCRYVIDEERKLVITTAWGCLTFAEVKAHQGQLVGDPAFSPEFNQLVDATAVIKAELSFDEARVLVGRKIFATTSRRAFVGSGLSIAAASRLMQAYRLVAKNREGISVFHDRDAALKWLGLGISTLVTSAQ